MSKPRKKKRKTKQSVQPARQGRPNRSWLGGLRLAAVAVVTLSIVGAALAAFKHSYEVEHDLSVVGQGTPTIVQIHNPGCSLCQQLRKNANAAMRGLDEQLLFRIADITTQTGHRLQRKHRVDNVTLLFFDGQGELRNVMSGVRDKHELRKAFERHIRLSPKRKSG